MTQAILLQSLTEIVTIGLLFAPTPTPRFVSSSHHVAVLAAKTHREPSVRIVQSGETLDSIASEVYGKESYWTVLWNDNAWMSDPSRIHLGDRLVLRDQKPISPEEIKRPLPTPTMTPTPLPTFTPTPQVIARPRDENRSLDQIYQDAGGRFGVPWQILYAIHMVETGQRDGPIDSGFGPQGPMQFLPSTFASYATDGNGDGVTDINNAADAIYTAANYIARHGSLDAALRAYGNTGDAVRRIASSRGWTP